MISRNWKMFATVIFAFFELTKKVTFIRSKKIALEVSYPGGMLSQCKIHLSYWYLCFTFIKLVHSMPEYWSLHKNVRGVLVEQKPTVTQPFVKYGNSCLGNNTCNSLQFGSVWSNYTLFYILMPELCVTVNISIRVTFGRPSFTSSMYSHVVR